MKHGDSVNGLLRKDERVLLLTALVESRHTETRVIQAIKEAVQRHRSPCQPTGYTRLRVKKSGGHQMLLTFHDTVSDINVKVMINFHAAVRSSLFILGRCAEDRRFQQLALVLRQWLQCHAAGTSLSPFDLCVLLMGFMQSRGAQADPDERDLQPPDGEKFNPTPTMGETLLQFFQFYGTG